jgi:hypothetical protein
VTDDLVTALTRIPTGQASVRDYSLTLPDLDVVKRSLAAANGHLPARG